MGRSRSVTEARLQFWLDVGLSVLTFVTAAAGVILLADPEWANDNLVIGTAWTAAVGAFVRSLAVARTDRRRLEDAVNEALLHQVALGLLQDVSERGGLDLFRVGIHIYLFDPGLFRNKLWLYGRTRQMTFRRPVRLRYPAHERHAGLALRPGVGVVGVAFENPESYVVQPCQTDWSSYRHDAVGWEARQPRDRAGLSFAQLRSCKAYGYVGALAFYDAQGRVAGCVSVDGPPELEQAMIDANDVISDSVIDAAVAITNTLFPPR